MLSSILPFLLLLFPNLSTSIVIYPEAAVFNTHTTHNPASLAKQHTLPSLHPTDNPSNDDDDDDTTTTPLPVILWHGLGDSASSDGIKSVATLLDTVHPGTYVYIVSLGAGSADQQASFFGNVSAQIESVCEALLRDPIITTAPAVDALGFSQGGQFLRGLLERCEGLTPVRSLLTFGAQHNGIARFQKCKESGDWVCRGAEQLVRSGGVWADFVQSRIVPAQYFRDPADLDSYLAHSAFLADINNERKAKNTAYRKRLSTLKNFVMVMFTEDETVVPKQSSWWAELNTTTGEVTELREREIYKEDWLGLKQLDEKGGLKFEKVVGQHMHLEDGDLRRLFKKYFGVLGKEERGEDVAGEL